MKKLIPAVFFQKQLNNDDAAIKTPERLELFESELRAVVGGQFSIGGGTGGVGGVGGVSDGSGGTTTYSGSQGWLDVEQADDCTY